MNNYNNINISERDKLLGFEPDKHIYTYQGKELASTSSVISSQFPEFDTEKWSAIKANERGVPQQKVKDEWEMSGLKATTTGTFMHEQIENTLLGNEVKHSFHFSHHTAYVNCDEEISINHELSLFRQFLDRNPLTPFRSEWHIFDEDTMIAGTIDLVTRNAKGEYEMWDWKRSGNIGKEWGTKFNIASNRFQHGFGKLAVLDDTSYNHYLLQQNMYAYLLKKHYNIVLKRMSLVVIHPSNKYYHILELPNREDLILTLIAQYKASTGK